MANIRKTTSGKRKQIDKTKARMYGVVFAASFISVMSLVLAKGYFSQAAYLNKVASKKETAVKTLKKNIDSVDKLKETYATFASQEPNLIGGSPKGTGDKDGDNGRLVLDALPSKYDYPAVATSLEKIMKVYKIKSIAGVDDEIAQADAKSDVPVEMPFTIALDSNYEDFQKLVATFGKSIRPIHITSLDLSGSNATLQVNMSAKTFYLPESGLKIETKVVK